VSDNQIERLRTALDGLLERYTGLVNCGDCGFWDPEKEDEVINARRALAETATYKSLQTPKSDKIQSITIDLPTDD
jgi:hypothetical protein